MICLGLGLRALLHVNRLDLVLQPPVQEPSICLPAALGFNERSGEEATHLI